MNLIPAFRRLAFLVILLACVTNGWSTDHYLEPDHPLQLLVRDTVTEFTDETVEHSGTDGCGAPVHALSLAGLARAIGRVSGAATGDAGGRLR